MESQDPDIRPPSVDEAVHALSRVSESGRLPPIDRLTAAWQAVMNDDKVRTQASQFAPRIAFALRSHGFLHEAQMIIHDALANVGEPTTRTLLHIESALTDLGLGCYPPDLLGIAERGLVLADRWLDAHRIEDSAAVVEQVVRALFHRELHTETLLSPLVANPRFIAPLQKSKVVRVLTGGGSYTTKGPGPDHPPRRPRNPALRRESRLLFVTDGNWHFLDGVCDHFAGLDGVDVRRLDLSTPGLVERRTLLHLITDRLRQAIDQEPTPALDRSVAQLLGWADTVFVDWCDNAALWATVYVPSRVRLIVRLHSVEALSSQPHLMDWRRTADLVFVAPHIMRLTEHVVPTIAVRTRRRVIPNYVRLANRFHTAKSAAARRTIALVGWASTVKDPLWAVDTLDQLRRHDHRWRLLLIGRDFPERLTASGMEYRKALDERLHRPELHHAVTKVPHADDLSAVLRDVGFVLSASRREGAHVGLIEAAASGCVPIIRDWPVVAPFGGPRTMFPGEWVVEDPRSAADRILRIARDDTRRTAAGEAARDQVATRYDWATVAPQYENLLLGLAVV